MYWCIYLYVIIGGIGKTYAAQDKHSSHGERVTRGSNAYIQSPVQQTPYTNDRECDLSYISIDLFMTDMLLEKLLTFPHAVNQILLLIFFIYKKILFLCILFLDTCCQNFSKKISSSSFNLNLLLIPKALPIFFPLGFVKISFSFIYFIYNKTYQCSKCKLKHYFSRFLTVSYVIKLTGENYHDTSMNFWRLIIYTHKYIHMSIL